MDMELNTTEIKTNRAILLADIENLVGSGDKPSPSEIQGIITSLDDAFSYLNYQPVVASSHRSASVVWFSWPKARKLVRSGPDGADLELLSVLEDEPIVGRYDTVIIGSGDHIFTNSVARLASKGLRIIAAVGRGEISRKLQMAVHEVVNLELSVAEDSLSA